ncbi:MAG: SusC/RagA family TonB-linked outer membrane protein [Chitinophagaceae bacterium]|nr:SusC/RagA family TonB-linked outer membrane protein [Chitinophagaceae bacterium]
MRKFTRALLVLLFIQFSLQTFSQNILVSGRIVSQDGTPVPDATVLLKGTKTGTKTDANGNFTIHANAGDLLLVSGVGFKAQQVKVNGASVSITMQTSTAVLEEVSVTTAMDIKRNPRELGYSAQAIGGKEIAETQRENFVNSLQGRVAGLTVTPTTGTAGASSSIVLRGFNSASLSNQPLFVVDGIIIDNSTFNETSNGGSGIGLASDKPNRANDYTNRIADINPSDIESITVLKGPEATALYGSQAGSGAIIITTKKPGINGKTRISYDNSFRIVKETRFPQLENNFSPGTGGTPSTNSFTYFGPAYPADVKRIDNVGNFFKTGFAQTHNVGVDFGIKNVGFRLSTSYFNEDGTIPNNTFKRFNIKLSNNTKINKYVTINPTISYINSKNDKPIRGAGGFLLDLYAWPVTDDASKYLDASGHKRLLYATSANTEAIDNPFFSAAKNHSQDRTDRVIATMGVDIHPLSWLTVAGRFGYEKYSTNGYGFYHPESSLNTLASGGALDNYYLKYTGYNHTINATANKKFGKFSVRLMAGTMWQDYETKEFAVSGTNLKDSSRTDSSNTLLATRVRLLQNAFNKPNENIIRQFAYFGEAGLSYNNYIFLDYTHRWEASSIFPAANRHYEYPGFSVSAIVSDMLPFLKRGNILNYFKLRGALATTARIPDPYTNQSVFVNNFASSPVPPYSYGFFNNNPNLKPEIQNTYEVGAELKFFNNLLSLDGTYYNTHNTDQISVGFRASYGTGFVLNTQNAAESRNQGIEITLGISPVKNKDWNWDIRFNYAHMWSNVIAIPASIQPKNDYYIGDTWLYQNVRGGLIRGHPTTLLTGYSYTRNNRGDILINPANGLPIVNPSFVPIGDRNPAFTLGTYNSIRYKNFSINFLWDLKVGGDIFNATDMYLTSIGRSARTSDRRTPRVVTGVLKDGLENTSNPTKNTILVTPYYNSSTYYNETAGMPDEEFIQKDVNWFRLRDITLNYLLPESFIKRAKFFKGLSVFATANDLILITNYNGGDPAVNGNTAGSRGVGAFGIDYGNVATPISLNFGFRANF